MFGIEYCNFVCEIKIFMVFNVLYLVVFCVVSENWVNLFNVMGNCLIVVLY